MAYSDFTLYDLRQQFGAHFRAAKLFPNSVPIQPSNWLEQALAMGEGIGFNSEKIPLGAVSYACSIGVV